MAHPCCKELRRLMREADRRYEQRFNAQEQARLEGFVAQEKATHAAMSAAEQAVLKAEAAAERRFEAVNEFRQTLSDQAALFVTRRELASLVGGVIAAAMLAVAILGLALHR